MTMPTTKHFGAEPVDDDAVEIRLSDVGRFLKSSWPAAAGWGGAFLLLALLYAWAKPTRYVATIRVMPELKAAPGTGGMGDLKSLAGLAGVSIDNVNAPEAIRPDLYPDIVASVPFALHLLGQPVVPTGQRQPRRLQEYLLDDYRRSLRGRLLGTGQSAPPEAVPGIRLRLSAVQATLTGQLTQRVAAAIDRRSGIITLTATLRDAAVAAQVAEHALTHLTRYVTNYRTGKARQQVRFLENQVANARRRYQSAEYALSRYRDLNRSLYLNTAKIEEQRLQSDFLLAQTVYGDLSKQLEQARIKVQEEAPVFEVLEPAHLPLPQAGPPPWLLAGAGAALGVGVGLSLALIRWIRRRKPQNS